MAETTETAEESALRALVLSLRADKGILCAERDEQERIASILMMLFLKAKLFFEAHEELCPPPDLVDLDYAVSETEQKLKEGKGYIPDPRTLYDDDAEDEYQPYQRRVCVLVERGTGMRQGLLCEWKESRVLFDSPEEIRERLGRKWDPIRYRIITYQTGYKLVDDGLGDA